MIIRAATYNIRNGDADDGPNSWEHRKSTLVNIIQRLDADVLGLQEVLDYQLDFILECLPEYESIGVGRIDGNRQGEFSPILYRQMNVKLNESGWFWISETPDVSGSKSWQTACERICTWANFEGLSVANTHLDHVSEDARREGIRLILARQVEGPSLVMGDLNALPSEEPMRLLLDAGYVDACQGYDGGTFHNWRTEPESRIDYLMGRHVRFIDPIIYRNADTGKDGSDHFPVSASIDF